MSDMNDIVPRLRRWGCTCAAWAWEDRGGDRLAHLAACPLIGERILRLNDGFGTARLRREGCTCEFVSESGEGSRRLYRHTADDCPLSQSIVSRLLAPATEYPTDPNAVPVFARSEAVLGHSVLRALYRQFCERRFAEHLAAVLDPPGPKYFADAELARLKAEDEFRGPLHTDVHVDEARGHDETGLIVTNPFYIGHAAVRAAEAVKTGEPVMVSGNTIRPFTSGEKVLPTEKRGELPEGWTMRWVPWPRPPRLEIECGCGLHSFYEGDDPYEKHRLFVHSRHAPGGGGLESKRSSLRALPERQLERARVLVDVQHGDFI